MSAKARRDSPATATNSEVAGSSSTKRDFCQYAVLENGKYAAAHETIPVLPAGSYHLDWEPNTGIIFKKLDIKGDKFLNLEESL